MTTPTLAIDCRFASSIGGLGTYTRSLVSALVTQHAHDAQYVLFVSSKEEEWLSSLVSLPSVTIVRLPVPHYSLREQLIFPLLLWKYGCTQLLVPHFNIPLLATIPITMTVHDLILHRYPNTHSWFRRIAYRLLFALAVLKATSIITITESTKNDLLSYYGWKKASTLHTIYPAATFQPSALSFETRFPDLKRPYFLYVGNAKEHKNVQFLIDAFLSAGLSSADLVLVTGGKEAASLTLAPSIHRIPFCSDEDLSLLYAHALAFVTASRAEGFCLPCIEAMKARTRVLASTIAPFPEVCSSHAILVPPSSEGFQEGMRRILVESPEERQNALENALRFAERYTWQRAADLLFSHLSL
jgi:glycosyltransferase involved in cell wall biosynthesis